MHDFTTRSQNNDEERGGKTEAGGRVKRLAGRPEDNKRWSAPQRCQFPHLTPNSAATKKRSTETHIEERFHKSGLFSEKYVPVKSNQNRRVTRRVMAGETPPYTQWSTAAGASRYGGRLVYKRYWGITRHRRKAMYRDTLEENLGRRWTSRQDNDPKLTATITQGGPTFPDFNPAGKVDLWVQQRAPRNHGDSKTIW